MSGTELRECIYVEHSILERLQCQYRCIWTKFQQRHANLPKLGREKV